ncbi:MAG: sodium:proton antiporter, partial [Desulfobulbaceae bacterium]|nr:sodium:proton antiporter [Desulfobulbaceae bacterium]
MGPLDIFATLITLAALFSYLNHRYIGLPSAIGIMALSLIISLVILGLGFFNILSISEPARLLLSRLDFYDTLMHGMLGFLLFAGALHV